MNAAVRAPGGGRKSNDNPVAVGDPELKTVRPPQELFDSKAKDIWRSQSKLMIEKGTLSKEDLPLLMAYCNTFSLLLRVEKDISKPEGLYVTTADGGLKKHPAMNIRNDCVSQLKMLGSMLGLDPMSRLRLVGGKSDSGDTGSEFDQF